MRYDTQIVKTNTDGHISIECTSCDWATKILEPSKARQKLRIHELKHSEYDSDEDIQSLDVEDISTKTILDHLLATPELGTAIDSPTALAKDPVDNVAENPDLDEHQKDFEDGEKDNHREAKEEVPGLQFKEVLKNVDLGNTVQGPEDCILQILACNTSASLQFDEISKCPTADSSIDATNKTDTGMSSSEITAASNVCVLESGSKEIISKIAVNDEDVLDLIVGDTEPEPGIRSSSKINVHIPEQSVRP